MTAAELASILDDHLQVGAIPDYPLAFNGLQVDRHGEVERIAFAVDAVQATLREAVAQGADMLVVHHGLLWAGPQPIIGRHYHRLKTLLEANLGLYSSHLPLDVHPEHGNNIVLARQLGIRVEGVFAEFRGAPVGVWGTLEMRREALAARLDQVLGCRIKMIAGGPDSVTRVGIITRAGGGKINAAREAGLDAFITGEVAHHNYFDAAEGGINLYLGGHYATEVWGVRALADFLRSSLSLDCFFIDNPTGL